MKSEMGRKSIILWAKKIIVCTLSLILLGIGCGINLATNQGADPITVFYDGLSVVSGITAGQVATILNAGLILIVLIFDFSDARKKANREGKKLTFFDIFNVSQISASLVGCLFCFIGLGGFMVVNIGIDPWTAAAVIITEKTKKSFGVVKIILDALTLFFGWLMGGVVGIITLFCAVAGGPIIQKSAEILDKTFKKMLKFD